MDSWEFGWSAIAAIGQVLGAFFTAAAVWMVLLPYIKRLSLNLVYYQDIYGKKKKALLITNESYRTITIVEFGVYVGKYIIKINDRGMKLEQLPLTLTQKDCSMIKEYICWDPERKTEEFDQLLSYCLLSKWSPFVGDNNKNPKVYFYVKSSNNKMYKKYIARRKDITIGQLSE